MKKVWINKTDSLEEAESFSIQFWQSQSAHIRFTAMWNAVDEFFKLKGTNGRKRRLQRSVQNIKQA